MAKIIVQDTQITVIKQNEDDYISLTDMLKAKDGEFFFSNWLRNRNTIEFLGIWERLMNPNFNCAEFDIIKSQAGLNRFRLSAKEWTEKTNAIGIIPKAGRYGGTYAHKDIAFEFAMWISPEFKVYLIREFQRLKDAEQKQLGWTAKRELSKINYRIHTDAIKQNLIPEEVTALQASIIYAEEADVLNVRHVSRSTPSGVGSIIQANNYYPFGGLLNEGDNHLEVQKRLYNGKEYDSMQGLNLYDYGARQYDPAICRFTSMDPLCEKYYHISPYAYCAGNPVKYVDPDGRQVTLKGNDLDIVLQMFQSYIGNSIQLSLDNDNHIKYQICKDENGNNVTMSSSAQKMINAIDSKNSYNITNTSSFLTSDGDFFVGGAFMGNNVGFQLEQNTNQIIPIVEANQLVNATFLGELDKVSGETGKNLWHEFTKMIEGGDISAKHMLHSPSAKQIDLFGEKRTNPISVYQDAHKKASAQSPVSVSVNGNTISFSSNGIKFYEVIFRR